jgi:hypothetical protein
LIIFQKPKTKNQKKTKKNQCQFENFQKPQKKPKKPMPNLSFYTRVFFGWAPPDPLVKLSSLANSSLVVKFGQNFQ